jgi:hypothetical protein
MFFLLSSTCGNRATPAQAALRLDRYRSGRFTNSVRRGYSVEVKRDYGTCKE